MAGAVAVLESSTRTPPPARFATPPTPGARHYGHQVAQVARLLGTPLMPWQHTVARVATECHPDQPGRWRYPVVVVSVPRQSGKTTLMRAVLAQRAIQRDRLLAFYTAQTGKDAAARWSDLVDAIEHGPLAPYVRKRLAAGTQALLWPNGSRVSPFAPTPKSLHGYTPHLVMVDEAFAFDGPAGLALEGAINPAQVTLDDRQLWIVSTMGSPESTWLHDWVDRGRLAAGDPDATVAYFEWSAPDAADLYDPATWWTYHPALGHTITQDALAERAQNTPPGEWERAFGNRRSASADPILDLLRWDRMAATLDALARPRPDHRIGLGYGVARDRSTAALFAAWLDDDGRAVSKVLRADDGFDWLPDAIGQALAAIPTAVVGAKGHGAVRQVTDALAACGVPTTTVAGPDWPTACGAWLHRAVRDDIQHDGSPALRAAIQVAQTRPAGESWAFSETASAGPVAALDAAVVALRLAEVDPHQGAPMIYTGAA